LKVDENGEPRVGCDCVGCRNKGHVIDWAFGRTDAMPAWEIIASEVRALARSEHRLDLLYLALQEEGLNAEEILRDARLDNQARAQ
jgi:hypothetical protein